MRGSPLLRALVAFLALLSLGYPLHRLTRAGDAPAAAAPAPAVTPVRETTLQLTFSAPPKTFRVLHLGQEVWSGSAPAVEIEKTLPLAYPPEGIDLQVQAEFPDAAAPAALRVQLTDPEGRELAKSLWGVGSIDDVLTFP